jgi:hypothetical protein
MAAVKDTAGGHSSMIAADTAGALSSTVAGGVFVDLLCAIYLFLLLICCFAQTHRHGL